MLEPDGSSGNGPLPFQSVANLDVQQLPQIKEESSREEQDSQDQIDDDFRMTNRTSFMPKNGGNHQNIIVNMGLNNNDNSALDQSQNSARDQDSLRKLNVNHDESEEDNRFCGSGRVSFGASKDVTPKV